MTCVRNSDALLTSYLAGWERDSNRQTSASESDTLNDWAIAAWLCNRHLQCAYKLHMSWKESVVFSLHIRSLYQVHDTRGTPKLHDKKYTLYTEFTHTPDLHLKLGTTNTHSLHQIHITREKHPFYMFHVYTCNFEKCTWNTRCVLSIFGVYPAYTLYTKNTRVSPEYVSAGSLSRQLANCTIVIVSLNFRKCLIRTLSVAHSLHEIHVAFNRKMI